MKQPIPLDNQIGEPVEISSWRRHLGLGTTAVAFASVLPIIAAIGFAKPWFVGLSAVPMLALLTEIATAKPPRLSIHTGVSARRVTQDSTVIVTLVLESSATGILHLRPGRGGGLSGADDSLAVEVARGNAASIDFQSVATRWGRGSLGLDRISWATPLGLIVWQSRVETLETVWVYPQPSRLRSQLGVSSTTMRSGAHRARSRGHGIEYHSTRPFERGDRWRDIDRRILAKSDELWARSRHAERSRDVVVIVDLIEDGRTLDGRISLADKSLRAAEATAQRHLGQGDRVGLLVLGKRVMSLPARDSKRQGFLIIDTLMRARPRQLAGLLAHRFDLRRRVEAGATVLVISPMFDQEIVEQIHALARHGRDVAVLQVGHDLVELGRGAMTPVDQSAADLYKLRSEATRTRLRTEGIPVHAWGDDERSDHAVDRIQLLHRASVRRRR